MRHHLSRLERCSSYFRVYSDYFVGWLCNVFVYQLVKEVSSRVHKRDTSKKRFMVKHKHSQKQIENEELLKYK